MIVIIVVDIEANFHRLYLLDIIHFAVFKNDRKVEIDLNYNFCSY